MDLYQFNFQDIKGRATLVWEHGNFIEFSDEGENRIVLYDTGKFFAEIWFDADMNQIKMVIGFKSLQCLDPYLEIIDLKDIIS